MLEIRKSQMTSDLFLSSVNAVTLNGELVNIDGIGNRVNSTVFGPGKVILVAGYNKIVDDVQEGIKRIKNVAAPLNARRLNIDVPCAKLGKCVDCNSPNRICRVIVIHERKPSLTDMLHHSGRRRTGILIRIADRRIADCRLKIRNLKFQNS